MPSPAASTRLPRFKLAALFIMIFGVTAAACGGGSDDVIADVPAPTLQARAVLPAATFASGPTSGKYIAALNNGQASPFGDKQPVQGFSAVIRNTDGSFLVMADNGYGSIETSADFNLRVYNITADFKTATNGVLSGTGNVAVKSFFELRDPDSKIPFAIVNHFSKERVLTGADFDIESMQRTADGTFWFGDEFGPFLIHTDATGRVLEAPYKLPDFENAGKDIRSPQNPYSEETAALRIMNAARAHALAHGGTRTPGFSPYYSELKFDTTANNANGVKSDPNAQYSRGTNLVPGLGLTAAASDIHDVALIKAAGFGVVPYTVNDAPTMNLLLKAGVTGMISDAPDLLFATVAAFDANGDGIAGDYLTADGLIDIAKFDAQGHRGGRNLRPENTLPAWEVALDNLMTTIETDSGITSDGVAVIKHDPYLEAVKCRRTDGVAYAFADEVLIRNLTAAEMQSRFICDKLLGGGRPQSNDLALSPVSVQVAAAKGYVSPYVVPRTQDLFDLVTAYIAYYKTGAGATSPNAAKRVKNAEKVRFNIETKINPRSDKDAHGNVYKDRTVGFEAMADTIANLIVANGMQQRADIQSFDFRTLIRVQERVPAIRTVYLFGDFPIYADPVNSDDGTNMQGEGTGNTPWMAGLPWPYRSTVATAPMRAKRSGGFEGMALSTDGTKLYPLLELPLTGQDAKTLLIHEFDLATKAYTGKQFQYVLDAKGTNIGEFQLFNATEGIIIERDNTQGDVNGFKKLFQVTLGAPGAVVGKAELVDLMKLRDPNKISGTATNGDVGLGEVFSFPFDTIEDVFVLDDKTLLVINDNNFPFSTGRSTGAATKRPADNELIQIRLPKALTLAK
ncbi:hypothetical protein BH09PSE5_BH09PSE5_07850 [soil metagenome]